MKNTSLSASESATIPMLDGLRGILALWVLLSHVTQLVNGPRGLIDRGGIAVDLFMLVSGFLMLWNIESRASKESPESIITWKKFFIRRFFRIAPLYYFALFFAFLFGVELKGWLSQIYLTQGLSFVRPFEACERNEFVDVLSHITFTFGFHPCYAASTIIPDWSLSLEMQFYALFPILYILQKKMPSVVFAALCAIVAGISLSLVGVFVVDAGKFISFPQPSILVLRINCFVVGMILARIFLAKNVDLLDLTALLISILLFQRMLFGVLALFISISVLRREICDISIFGIMKKPLDLMAGLFELKWTRLLGDLSYGVYLLHIFVIIPLVYKMLDYSWFVDLGGFARFIVISVLSIPVVLVLSKICYEYIERPMIKFGRHLVR